MAEENPSIAVDPVIFPRPVTGHRRFVQVAHPFCGNRNLLTTEASWSDANQPNFSNYAFTPPRGPKQRGVHTHGAGEITWSLGGELTNNTIGLLGLMNSNARGVQFRSILMSQGIRDSYLFDNPDTTGSGLPTGFALPWSNFTLAGSPNGAVTFTLEGKSTQIPIPNSFGSNPIFPDVPIPSWYTGNSFVTAWSMSHSVNITPNWVNTPWPYPAYYRPGHSEFTVQVTLKVNLLEHSTIRFGTSSGAGVGGGVSILEAVITSRNRTFGGRGEPVTYQVTTTNAAVQPDSSGTQNIFGPSIDIFIPTGPAAGVF